MGAYDTEATAILRRLGWRIRSKSELALATRNFQRAWLLGPALVADGVPGPKTISAMRYSDKRRAAGQGTASTHFSFIEFRCRCGGKYSSCARIWVKKGLIQSLETYRATAGAVTIVSGCRCTGHNKAVGGVSNSQHLYGSAADVPQRLSTNRVRYMRRFSGIGYQGSTGLVRHVDRRDVSGHNTTGSSVSRPTVWRYA